MRFKDRFLIRNNPYCSFKEKVKEYLCDINGIDRVVKFLKDSPQTTLLLHCPYTCYVRAKYLKGNLIEYYLVTPSDVEINYSLISINQSRLIHYGAYRTEFEFHEFIINSLTKI